MGGSRPGLAGSFHQGEGRAGKGVRVGGGGGRGVSSMEG